MKEITISICGQEFCLFYNGAAMYALRDKYGADLKKLFELMDQGNAESYFVLCDTLAELITQGELYRRWLGYDKGKIVTASTLQIILRPVDIPLARQAVLDAIVEGMRNETPEDEDIDLGLQELEAKNGKKKASRKRST